MPSTAIRRVAAAALLSLSMMASGAKSDTMPRYLPVPVLGLRLEIAGLKLAPLPDDLRAMCDQIADNKEYTGRVWIFGQAKDAATTYYVLGGYFKRRTPAAGRRLYEVWDKGSVFTIRGEKCGGDDAVETFNVRDPNADNDGNVPIPILRELARDLAARAAIAFGGASQLRAEIRKQRIDFNQLSPALQEAFAPYFGK